MDFVLPFDPHWFLRFAIGVVMLYHGLTKDLRGFGKAFGFSLVVSGAVIFAEVASGLGYLLGGFYHDRVLGLNLTQWASLAAIPVLVGAIYLVHWKNGFNNGNGGYEYQMTLLAIALYFFFKESIYLYY